MSPKVSILVPVYKTTEYIEKCAESLFKQSFKDIEYIFVNDATPDDSIEKLQKVIINYPERKRDTKIIHNSFNQGLAVSRNIALEASTGSYIAVVDSDDYIDPNMIELLYQKAMDEDADIVVSDIAMEYTDKTIYVKDYLSENKNDHFRDIILNDKSYTYLCNKLVRRDLYLRSDCRVPKGLNYLEDRHVMSRLFFFAQKIVKVDQAFYHYVQYNTNAITKTKDRMHFENLMQFWNLFDAFLREHNVYEDYKPIMALPKTQGKVRLMIDTHSCQLRKEYADIFIEEEKLCFSQFSKAEKLMLLLVRYKYFCLAQLFHDYLVLKNLIKRKFLVWLTKYSFKG